ncbi:bifunctional 5,10-methylenetetrahydrofolate dehydrogenase/5,10-methenyltetrahydrofolate cyclohydrolase [Gordonibacter sp.]|uniref:bifunctional 5,10-methylenetetrahydrofolate dehydrogenase/5,10-methenyltetrahydrofolate cyclohydrolase n=1 Tax=Gordonibacter sp. TaxID=1968902 RepID=UPI002FC6B3B3
MADLLLGKGVVDRIAADLGSRIEALKSAGVQPTLALVRMGERPDDLSYERTACKRAESLGIAVRSIVLDVAASQGELEAALRTVSNDAGIHGCLLFRPLPAHIDDARACAALAASKDIDGITLDSLASVFTDGSTGFPPATAAACMEMLACYDVPLEGKHVAVVGRSLVVGKPVSMMLLAKNATVTMCHSRTDDLAGVCRAADIVICATGRARMFGADYFSPGQTVLDVGINFDDEGNLCGDVDFDAAEPVVAAITPVPRGIGTVTTSVTMAHVVEAAERLLAAPSGGAVEGENR